MYQSMRAAEDQLKRPRPRRSPGDLVALIGMPNAGKTSVFNALTHSNYQTVNYPGSTVDYSVGSMTLGERKLRVMDVPGITSLTPQSQDENVAIQALFGESPHGLPALYICVADATQLDRHLYLARRLIDSGFNVAIVVTMGDILRHRKGMVFDHGKLGDEIGCPVIPMDGRTGEGSDALKEAIGAVIDKGHSGSAEVPSRPSPDEISAQYVRLRELTSRAIGPLPGAKAPKDGLALSGIDGLTAALDRWFLHPVLGLVLFMLIMAALFTSIFWLAQPVMDMVDRLFSAASTGLIEAFPGNWVVRLLADGVILGTGAVAVFLPQIIILFMILGFLEDSGYLARGAMIVDRSMRSVGLSGRSFVPILSGFACAIPAMMASRAIPSRRERLMTILILPLMLCSARLPVYGLLVAFLTPPGKPWVGGLTLTALYVFSATTGLVGGSIVGGLMGLKQRRATLLLELPALRRPKMKVVLITTMHRTKAYIQKAGTAILVIAVVLWALTNLPVSDGAAAERITNSYAAKLGQWMEPVMEPIGLDWRVGVALICAFAAREVFVSALALMLMVSSGDTLREPLLLAMREATRADGTKLFTVATCAGIIIYFVFALQCMATLAVCRKETGSWRIPVFQLVVYNLLGYGLAVVTVHGLRFLGVA